MSQCGHLREKSPRVPKTQQNTKRVPVYIFGDVMRACIGMDSFKKTELVSNQTASQ